MNKYFDNPTVSVLVITYNSSKYVLDTLESVKNQTYSQLSLIISDDCSSDNTLELCKSWIQKNRNRFIETTIIESPVNTGISANINRGERVCRTMWLKGIAGDDVLMPNCIRDNVLYINKHPNSIILFSDYKCLYKHINTPSNLDKSFFLLPKEKQYERLLFGENCLPAMTSFYNVQALKQYGLANDERIPLLDDWPRWLNALKLNIPFSYMDKCTVLYRIHNNSLSTGHRASPCYYKSLLLFYYLYQREDYIKKFGVEYVIKREIEKQFHVYNQYYVCRNLISTKIYFTIKFYLQKFQNIFRK